MPSETVLPDSPRRPSRAHRSLLVLGLLAALVGVGGTAVMIAGASSPTTTKAAAPAVPVAPVTSSVVGARGTTVPWQRPLTFSVDNGSLTKVSVTGPRGRAVEGVISEQTWRSTGPLSPSSRFTIVAEVEDEAGEVSTVKRVVQTTAAAEQLTATFAQKGGTFGVGQPLVVRFDQKVKGVAARKAVLEHLHVKTTPAVVGAWRWFNSYEAHYRPARYWRPGTKVSATAALAGLNLPGTPIWGAGTPATGGFTVGRSMTSVVDLKAHTMTVRRDGKVVRVMKISAGSPRWPTKGGVHLVLTRERTHLFNSATVGIPTASPDGYYKVLPYAVRISNGGAFVHAQPGTVRQQGRRNVSHGCINASTKDARWFYENSLLGDVVDVVNWVVGPVRTDAGMADWNYTWDAWKSGNLDG